MAKKRKRPSWGDGDYDGRAIRESKNPDGPFYADPNFVACCMKPIVATGRGRKWVRVKLVEVKP